MNTVGYSRPLALCSVISVTRPLVAAAVGVGDERDLLQEDVERVLASARRRASNSRAHLHELLEVLDAALRLDRALGLERLDVAGLRTAPPRADRRPGPARASHRRRALPLAWRGRGQLAQLHRVHEPAQRLHRRGAEAGDLLGLRGGRPTPGLPERVGVGDHARERGLADAAPRRVGDPREAHDVGRVGEQRQVRDRVLDLRAFVELACRRSPGRRSRARTSVSSITRDIAFVR